jgi:phage FluMu protein Com
VSNKLNDTMADILFNCRACGKSLVIDGAGIGLEVACPHCNAALTVPQVSGAATSSSSRAEEISPIASPPKKQCPETVVEFDEFADIPLDKADQDRVRRFWWPFHRYVGSVVTGVFFGWETTGVFFDWGTTVAPSLVAGLVVGVFACIVFGLVHDYLYPRPPLPDRRSEFPVVKPEIPSALGVPNNQGAQTMYCTSCGSAIAEKAVICPHCGCPTENYNGSAEVSRSVIVASYIGGAIIPLIGFGMVIYLLVKRSVVHAIGVAIVSIFMMYFWQGFWVGLWTSFLNALGQ